MNRIGEYASVYNAFEACAERFGDNAFLRAPAGNTVGNMPQGISYSYAEARARVALIFDSRLEVYLHLLALNALGVSIVPLHSLGTDEDLRYMILHSDCRVAVPAASRSLTRSLGSLTL